MRLKVFYIIIICFFSNLVWAKLTPTQLCCEYLKDTPIIDKVNPNLSWINIAEIGERDQVQTAWQIRVATSVNNLANPNLWESGEVVSGQSTEIAYNGKALTSRQECWWQVRVWDSNNEVSSWSEPAMWRMGLLNADEWQAKWIGAPWQGEEALPKPPYPGAELKELPPPAPLFRKQFNAPKSIEKATAYVTGLGYFEFYVNGNKISDDVLVPNQTNYAKRPQLINENLPVNDNFQEYKVMYLAYDITNQLQQGENVIGSILGNGFYNPSIYWTAAYGSPRFLAQIHITFTDGTEEIIVSDESWRASKSAILMDMLYYGEHYDARLEQKGWCEPGFDDKEWQNAVQRKAPEGKLVAHAAIPDKVTLRIPPKSINKTDDGKYMVDFGVEVSGWLKLINIEAPAGHKIEIKYLCNTYSGDNSYICKGGGKEKYAARFNWFVFSAVEIINWPGELKAENLMAEVVNTAVEESAQFETSNPLFNDINKFWKQSQIDNMHGGVASDCPHRERSAYTGDGQVTCVTVMHNFDARAFYQKWIQDIAGAQDRETGYVPNSAPWQPGCGGGVAWGAAIVIMPWEFYCQYGNLNILKDNFSGMKEYIKYMQTWVNADGIMHSQKVGKDGLINEWLNLGEWCEPGAKIPVDLVHTFYFWYCADLTAKTAKALNNCDEEKKYADLAEKTKQAFYKKFFDEENGTYGKGGGNILALKMGVPTHQYERVVSSLKNDIKANKGHLDTGIFGTRFFFEVLSENGMHNLAYEAMNKKTKPGFGYSLEMGATTTWEDWDGKGSQNHPMFGGGLVWFYHNLAGMITDPNQPGYKHIIFKPQPVADINYVSYYNNTVLGKAGIRWEISNNVLTMNISVPVGSNATVYVPSNNVDSLKESGIPINQAKGISGIALEQETIAIEVESGEYQFEVNQ